MTQHAALPNQPLPAARAADPVVIDCDTCRTRGTGCGDCVMTVLWGSPPMGVILNDEERRAVEVLAAAGLLAPLRPAIAVDAAVLDAP